MRETADHLRLFTIDDPSRREPDHETERDASQAIVMAARRLRHAEARFETAVQAGRREGLTWRQIGTAAGRPFQTLQRRASHGEARLTHVDGYARERHARRRRNR